MRVYTAELICSTGVSGFQTFKPVFCIYNKLRLHAEMLRVCPWENQAGGDTAQITDFAQT